MSGVLGTVAVLAAVAIRHTPGSTLMKDTLPVLFEPYAKGTPTERIMGVLKYSLPVAMFPLLGTLMDTPRETVIRKVATQKKRGGGNAHTAMLQKSTCLQTVHSVGGYNPGRQPSGIG